MMHEKMRRGDRGVVLIVIVGVLAVLSLLAATFGMIARLELATSRNQTEYEMAREAANAGSEALINALQTWLNGNSMTSGALPTVFPNATDTDGILQYKRDGVKVYFAVNGTPPAGSVTPDWLQGLGLQDYGMFNINAMGFAGDLGSNVNPDIRYTSFDCSLVQLLTSRFGIIANAPINSTDMANLQQYDQNLNGTPIQIAKEEQRVAIFLSRALLQWRYGPDGLPGTAGTEERRLGHLPLWNSRLGCTNVNAPIQDPLGNPYPFPPGWGINDNLASLLINWTGWPANTLPMSYFKPGEWRSYSSTDTTWGNDTGLPAPGLFWGKVGAGSTPNSIVADNTQPGWRNWPANMWLNTAVAPQYTYKVYFATGLLKWTTWGIINNSGLAAATTLSVANMGIAPAPGDSFCIFAAQPYNVGQLNQRWLPGDPAPEGDLVPNAMPWPNGALATDQNVLGLVLYSGAVLTAGNTPSPSLTDTTPAASLQWNFPAWTQQYPGQTFVVHIYGGDGRGQVRTIPPSTYASYAYPNITNQLTLSTPWTAGNIPDGPGSVPPSLSPSLYRIELADDNLPSKFQPNNLQGDDRLYLSLGDLRDSVIVPALLNDGLSPIPALAPLSSASAQAVADILMPYFMPYLTVSTQAIQASQSLCSINDWAVDGVDNDANGIVDDPGVASTGEAQHEQSSPQQANAGRAALALSLYNGLGLSTWAHTNAGTTATRVQQAAQLVANIIDFRDPTDVPTMIAKSATRNDLNETAATIPPIPNFTVYGAKGLHVTQVMPSPDAIYSATEPSPAPLPGWEMISDGQNPPVGNPVQLTDGIDWDFNSTIATPPGNCWQVMTVDPKTGLNPVASFTFPNLMPGYYAMRLIGAPQGTTYTVTYTQPWPGGLPAPQNYYASMTTPDPDTTYYVAGAPYWYTGFVRKNNDGSGALACFEVVPNNPGPLGSLTFQLQLTPPQAVNLQQFRGFALCAQYIQLTNIAAHDINLNTNGIGWTVATDQTAPAMPPPPAPQTPPLPITIPATYLRALDGNTIRTDRIHGAVVGALGTPTSATFPINYGTYVICMCEEAYERQWTARSGDPDYNASTNGDGLWGNAANEVCTLFPYGDCPTNTAGVPWPTAQSQNNATMALLLGVKTGPTTGYAPAVMVSDPAGDLIAGNLISATPPVLDGVDGLILIPQLQLYANGGFDTGSIPPTRLFCYSSIEKNVLLQPTWDTTTPPPPRYWAPCWNAADGALPTQLVGYQNVLTTVLQDPPRNPAPNTYIRTYLNRNYNNIGNPNVKIWNITPPPVPTPPTQASTPAVLSQPSSLVAQNRVFPIILNRPYPTTGWLGLVPTSNTDLVNSLNGSAGVPGSWRTIDPNPNAPVAGQVTPPATPEQLLGTLMSNATVGGVYARFNINTAPEAVLNTVFPSTFLTNGGGATVSPMNSAPPLTGPGTLTDTSQNWPLNNYTNMVVFIDAGTGQGQVRLITSNSNNTLTLNRNWDTLPDTTSKYRIMNSQAGLIICAREQRGTINPPYPTPYPNAQYPNAQCPFSPSWPAALAYKSWYNWDELLNDPLFQYSPNAGVTGVLPASGGMSGIGFYDNPRVGDPTSVSNADAGAGTYADGFPDSSNERKEWFMRYANLFCLQSTSFQFTVAGLVYADRPWITDPTKMDQNEPVAMVRIEVDVDLSTGTPSIVHFRYLTQQ